MWVSISAVSRDEKEIDNMKDKILSLFTNPSEMTPEQIVLNIGIAAVLGFFIFISYYISHRGTITARNLMPRW